jgi:hypothetical protein
MRLPRQGTNNPHLTPWSSPIGHNTTVLLFESLCSARPAHKGGNRQLSKAAAGEQVAEASSDALAVAYAGCLGGSLGWVLPQRNSNWRSSRRMDPIDLGSSSHRRSARSSSGRTRVRPSTATSGESAGQGQKIPGSSAILMRGKTGRWKTPYLRSPSPYTVFEISLAKPDAAFVSVAHR